MQKFAFALLSIKFLFACEITGPSTCGDVIQNDTETGVDCGGNCPPCTSYTITGERIQGQLILCNALNLL